MKDLFNYIEECGEVVTPANTMGMGDVSLPDGNNIGTDAIPQKKKSKKKKVSESLFDDESQWMDRMDSEVKALEWLATHIEHDWTKDEAMRLLSQNVTFNPDGTIDLPACTFLVEKSYRFNLNEEIPDYVKIGTIANRYNIFNINAKGTFKTKGFPKDFMSNSRFFNCTIYAPKLETLMIEEGTCNNIDLLIINTSANDVWMDKYATIFNAELNRLDRKCKNAATTFHNIPHGIVNLGLSYPAMEKLLKECGAISWGTKLITK